MTRYIGTLYFLGQYRPLYVEGESPEEVLIELSFRAQEAPEEVQERLRTLWATLNTSYASQSVEHGCYGASIANLERPPLDPELWQPVWTTMPPCPGLIYN